MEFIRFQARQPHDFYEVVCQRVQAYFESSGTNRYGNWLIVVKGLFYGLLTVGSYAAILTPGLSPWIKLIAAVMFGSGSLCFILNVTHDAAHGALFKSRRLNRWLYLATFNILGISGYLWQRRHINSHHMFPNINGCDTDIDDNPILRFSPHAPYKPWFRFQHWYAIFIYCIVGVHAVFIKDFLHLSKKHLANMHDIKHPISQYIYFALGKVGYVLLFFLIPYWCTDLAIWQILVGYLVSNFINSIFFVMCFAGTHFADECIFPVRTEGSQLELSYAEHAMRASLDWNAMDPISNFVVGGINCHAAHHLFPHVCHVHYPPITKIIEKTAKEFDIPYNQTTLWGMIKSHFRLLKHLSVPNGQPSSAETLPQLTLRSA